MTPKKIEWATGLSLLCCAGLLHAQTTVPVKDEPDKVAVWITTGDAVKRLERQPNLAWSRSKPAADADLLVNDAMRYQTMEGYGATLADPAIWNASPTVRREVMHRLFSRIDGIGLSVLRIPMGDIDAGGQGTTYDDLPNGQTDLALRHFSIAADEAWKIPFVQEAKRLNPQLEIIGTPWSAPAWMKDSGNLGKGKLKPDLYGVYADYFRKWIGGWKAHGLTISAVTLQNEPHNEPGWYQGMRMEATEQAAFVKVLGPRLKDAGLHTRIWCWDHNWDEPDYPIQVLKDPDAAKWLDGTTFHAYAGDVSAMSQVHDAFPDKNIYFTEITGSYSKGDDGPQGFGGSLMWQEDRVVAAGARNWSRVGLLWKLGITEAKPIASGGDRPITRISPDGKNYEFEGEYYVLAHVSKFVLPGACRIDSSQKGGGLPLTVAFQNPDGSKVLIVYEWGPRHTFTIEDHGRFLLSELPENSVATFVWHDAHPEK